MRVGIIVGRILLSLIFLASGLQKLLYWQATAGFMAAKGLPAVGILLALAVVCELGGGLLLLTGVQARLGAVVLFLYLIPVTLSFHNFWAYTDADRQAQQINFMKNVAIMGGLLVVASSPEPDVET